MRRLLRKILFWSIPELRLLRNSYYDFSLISRKNQIDIRTHKLIYAPYCVCDTEIGEYTYIAENACISKTTIGKFCSIGPNFLCGWGIHPVNGISTAPMFYSTRKQNGMTLSSKDKIEERKEIVIGNDVFIGANVTVLDGVTIGDGAVIGAGAVVSKNIPPFAVAVGCPINVVRYRFEENQIEALKRIKWWNFDQERLNDVEKFFFDVNGFIQYEEGLLKKND